MSSRDFSLNYRLQIDRNCIVEFLGFVAPGNEVENLNTYELANLVTRAFVDAKRLLYIEGEREFVKINAIEAHITSGDVRKGTSLFYNDER